MAISSPPASAPPSAPRISISTCSRLELGFGKLTEYATSWAAAWVGISAAAARLIVHVTRVESCVIRMAVLGVVWATVEE